MTSNVTMEDLVRPNKVEGLDHWVDMVYDKETDTIVPSTIVFWVRYLRDVTSLAVRRLTMGDGSIREAAGQVFDAAVLVAEGLGLEPGDEDYPRRLDVPATWAAACSMAKDSEKTAADLVELLAGKPWGLVILKGAYGS